MPSPDATIAASAVYTNRVRSRIMTNDRNTAHSSGFMVNRLCRRLRNRLLPRRAVTILADGTSYECGACRLILSGDLLEVSGHVSGKHGSQSFVLEEQSP